MATAGRILIMPKGAYNASTTYEMLDLVTYNGSAWIAKKTVVGIAPVDGEYWQCLLTVALANNLTTTEEGMALDARQGKILATYHNQVAAELKTVSDKVASVGSVKKFDFYSSVTYSHTIAGRGVAQKVHDNKYNIHMQLEIQNTANKNTVSQLFYPSTLKSSISAKDLNLANADIVIRPHLVAGTTNTARYFRGAVESDAVKMYAYVSGAETLVTMDSFACKNGTMYDVYIYGAEVTY